MFAVVMVACALDGSQVTDECFIIGGGEPLVKNESQCNSQEVYDRVYQEYLEIGLMPTKHFCIEVED